MVNAVLLATCATLSNGGVPSQLLDSLTRGVNVTRWFCYLGPGDQTAHFQTYFTPADYETLDRLGVKFVRLCISPDAVYRSGSYKPEVVQSIDSAVKNLISHRITVIWDLHDNGQLKLDQDSGDKSGFMSFWSQVAKHYRGQYKDRLIFELLNEPVFQKNSSDWYTLQSSAVHAIRSSDPDRTIMVTSTSWSSIDTLASMQPLPEKNLIYTFHCYDPFFFTHQGAEWVGEYPKNFQQIPFPSSPEAVASILPLNDAKYKGTLEDYGRQHYDDAYLMSRLSKGVEWGTQNHVPVLLGEFGAYPKVSPPESRARWFEGMRAAIDQLHLANAIWGYDDGLGLGRSVNADGTLHLDPVTLLSFYHEAK